MSYLIQSYKLLSLDELQALIVKNYIQCAKLSDEAKLWSDIREKYEKAILEQKILALELDIRKLRAMPNFVDVVDKKEFVSSTPMPTPSAPLPNTLPPK